MAWYIEAGPQENVVLSSRVRIARNLQELPFPNRLNPEQAAAVEKQIEGCFLSLYPSQSRADWNIVRLAELEDMQRLALAEKHFLSRRMLEPGYNKTLIISKDESLSMMILEEDHLRIQAMSAGLDLEQAYRSASDLTCKLEAKLPLAWDDPSISNWLALEIHRINQRMTEYKKVKYFIWDESDPVLTTTLKIKRNDELQRIHQELRRQNVLLREVSGKRISLS